MKNLKLLFVILSCTISFKGYTQSKEINLTETRKVNGAFTAVVVDGVFDISFEPVSKDSITIGAPEKWHSVITSKVSQDTLFIALDYKKDVNWIGQVGSRDRVTLTLPDNHQLKYIQLINDAHWTNIETIDFDELSLITKNGSIVKAAINSKALTVNTSAGSHTTLTGQVNYLKLTAREGSFFNGRQLKTSKCVAFANGDSKVSLNVAKELTAQSSNGADIRNHGSAKQDKTQKTR